MTPMVQLSLSLSAVSSSVRLSRSTFIPRSCWMCSVKFLLSLPCSEMAALTVVREERVTVWSAPFSEILYFSVKAPGKEQADLQWIARAMTTDTRTTQMMTKAAAATWSRGYAGALSLLSGAQRTVLFMTNVQPQKIRQILCVQS